ncbi:hypothetical protein ACSBR2_038439 [Camellia fascicularis]
MLGIVLLALEKPKAYVHNYFSKETYLRTYSFMINPVPGEHDWIKTGYDAIAPSYYRKPAGRPRKERKKTADEPKNLHKLSRKNKTVQRAKCMDFGHNKSSCKVLKCSTSCNTPTFIPTSCHSSCFIPTSCQYSPSSSQPAATTQPQPTMPCEASASGSASAKGVASSASARHMPRFERGFTIPERNAKDKGKGLRD